MKLGGAAQQLAHLLVRRWKKFRYHCPTAQKGSGVTAQTTRSSSASNSEHVEDEAMGTATTICAGAFFRKAVTATRMEEPVARPSSTRIAVRPPHHSGIDYFLGNSESVDHVTVQDRNAPGRQSSHCKFFLSGERPVFSQQTHRGTHGALSLLRIRRERLPEEGPVRQHPGDLQIRAVVMPTNVRLRICLQTAWTCFHQATFSAFF